MKFGNLMTIYYRQTRKNRLKGLAILLLFTIAIAMIHMAIYEQEICRYNVTVTKNLFEERDNLYNIKIWVTDMGDATVEGMAQFLEQLKRLDGVETSGRFYVCSELFVEMQENTAFLEYNQKLKEETMQEVNPAFFEMYYIDRSLTYLLGVDELAKGKRGDIIPVLVGYNYRDYFKEGDIYTNLDGVRFQVCGVLPEGFYIPSTMLLNSDSPCEFMDNKMIAVYDEIVDPLHVYILNGANSIYCITDGDEGTVEQIKELAKESFIYIQIDTIDDMITQYEEDNKWTFRTTELFTGITVLAAFLAMISFSIIQIILKKQEYGILFANGVSRGEGMKLIALETGIRQLVAFIMGTIIAARKIESMAMTYAFQKIDIFKEMVVWKTLLIVLILFIGSISIPAIVLGKMKTVELLGGSEL